MFRQSSLALRFASTTTAQARHISSRSYALDTQNENLVRTWYKDFKDDQINRKHGKVTKTSSGTVTLHYPLVALFSQIPVQLRPKIEKSKYHQQRDQVTIPIEGDISSCEKETMAWETLVTMIHSATLASLPHHRWKRLMISRETKDKVASLEKVEREYRYQNAKGTTDAEKARIAKLAHNAMVSKDYANYSKTSSRSRNSKKKLKK